MSRHFAKNLEDASNDELSLWINTLHPDYVKLASDELTRRSLRKLNESIDQGTSQARESSMAAEKFTLALGVLAVVQLLVAVFQLIISFAYSDNFKVQALGIIMVLSTSAILFYFSKKIFKRG